MNLHQQPILMNWMRIYDTNRFIPPNPPRQSPRAMWRAVKRAVNRWFHRGYHEDDGAAL